MKKALLLLVFGLLPVWVMLLFLATSALLGSNPGTHITSAPWLIVAVILCSIVTLTLTIYAVRKPPPNDSFRLPDDT